MVIISGVVLFNVLELVEKDIVEVWIIVNGVGVLVIFCMCFYVLLGVCKENIFMYDSKGFIYFDWDNLDGKKLEFVNGIVFVDISLVDILDGVDVFIGLLWGNVLSKEMVKCMVDNFVIFVMVNLIFEISYEDVIEVCLDCIMVMGCFDYFN